jgi:cytochrome b6-f complex subunit 7
MSAESMMFNGFIISIVTVLFGLAWGFLILKIQNKATKAK